MSAKAILRVLALVSWLPMSAQAFVVYHSDDPGGVNPGTPALVSIGGPNKVLDLWVDNGSTATPVGPCAGTGVGDEVCMWDLHVVCDPGITVVGFTPDPAAGVVANQQPAFIRLNGGEPLAGTLGPSHIGDLTVSASASGDCNLVGEAWVDTGLNANAAVSGVPLASACNNADGDSLCDPLDACPFHALVDPTDQNSDGIPDECQCGDTSLTVGFLTGADSLAQLQCGANPGTCVQGPPVVALWDANGDGSLTGADALATLQNGAAGTEYLNVCARRPGFCSITTSLSCLTSATCPGGETCAGVPAP